MPVISIVKVAGSVFDGPTSHDSFRHPVKIPLKKEQQQRGTKAKQAANSLVSLFPSTEKESSFSQGILAAPRSSLTASTSPAEEALINPLEDAHEVAEFNKEGTFFDAKNAKNLYYPSVVAESIFPSSYNVATTATTATDAECCWGLPYRSQGIETVWNEDNTVNNKKENEREEEPGPLPVSVAPTTSFTVSVVTPPPPPPQTYQPRTVPTVLRSSSGGTKTIDSPIVASSSGPCSSAFRGLKPLYSSDTRDALKTLPANAIAGLDEAMRVRHNPYAGTTAPAIRPPATIDNATTTANGSDGTPIRYVNGRRLPPSIILRAKQGAQVGVSGGASMGNSTPSSSSNTSVISGVDSVCSDRGGQKRPAAPVAALPPPPPPSYKLSSNQPPSYKLSSNHVTQRLDTLHTCSVHVVDANRANGNGGSENEEDDAGDQREIYDEEKTMPATRLPQLDASSIPESQEGQSQMVVEAATGVGAIVALPHRVVVSTVMTVQMERLGKREAALRMAQHQWLYQNQLALLREQQQQLHHDVEEQRKPSQQQQQQQHGSPSVSEERHHERYSHDPYASMNATSSRRVFTVVAVPIAFSPATREAVAAAQQVRAMLLRKGGDSGQLLSVSSTDVSTIASDGGLPTPSPSYPFQAQAMDTADAAAGVVVAFSEEDLEKTMSRTHSPLPPTSADSAPVGVAAASGAFSSLTISNSNNCHATDDGGKEASCYPPSHQPSFVAFSTSGVLTQMSAQTNALDGGGRETKVADLTLSPGVLVSERKSSVAMPPPLPSLLRAGPEGTWDISSSLSSTIDEPYCAKEEKMVPQTHTNDGVHGNERKEDCTSLPEGLRQCSSGGVTYALDYVVYPSRRGSIDTEENKEEKEEEPPLDMLRAVIRGGRGGAGDCAGLVIEENNNIEGPKGQLTKLNHHNHGSSSVELLNNLTREMHRTSHAKEVKIENSFGPSTNTTNLNQFTTRRNVRIVEIAGGAPAPSYPVRHCYFNVCASSATALGPSNKLNTSAGNMIFSSSSSLSATPTPTPANAATCSNLPTNHDECSYTLIAQFTSLAPSSQANPHLVCNPFVTGCSVYSYREARRRGPSASERAETGESDTDNKISNTGNNKNTEISVSVEVRTEAIGYCSLETYVEKRRLLKVQNEEEEAAKRQIKEEAVVASTTISMNDPVGVIAEDTTETFGLSPKTSLQATQKKKKKSNLAAIGKLVPSPSTVRVAVTECLTPISSVIVSDTPVGQGTEGHGVLIANATKHVHIASKRGGGGVNSFGADRSVVVVSRPLGRTLASPSLSSPLALTVPSTNETTSDTRAKCREVEDASQSRGWSCAPLAHYSAAATTATAMSTPLAGSVLALFQRAERKREEASEGHDEEGEGGGETTSHRGVRYYGLSSPLSSAISVPPMPRRCLTYTPSSPSEIPPHFFAGNGVEGSAAIPAHSNPRAVGVTSSPFPSGSVVQSRCETPAATPPAAEIESLLLRPSFSSSSYHCPLSKRAAAAAAAAVPTAMCTPIGVSVSAAPIGTLPHFQEKTSELTQKQIHLCSGGGGNKEQQQHLSSLPPSDRTKDMFLGYGSSLSLSLNNTLNVHEDEAPVAACGEIVYDTTTAKKNTLTTPNKAIPAPSSSSSSMHSSASGVRKVLSDKSLVVTASSKAAGGGVARPSAVLSRYLPRPTAVLSSSSDASPRRSNMYRPQEAMGATSSSSVAEAMEAFQAEYTYMAHDTAVTQPNPSRGTRRSTAARSDGVKEDHGLIREQILCSTHNTSATTSAPAIRGGGGGGGGVDGSCPFASSSSNTSFSPLSRLGTYTRNKARLSSYAN